MTAVGLIWAQSVSGVIGRDGGIPWRVPEDQARFRELTTGHSVLMGRLTWESLPAKVRPLPGRRNIVLTSAAGYVAKGAEVFSTLDAALAAGDGETWIIGGGQVYALALPRASRCEVTEIDVTLPRDDGDVIAPVLDEHWMAEDAVWQTSSTGLRYRFSSYWRAA
jgi:dihydrofolate reductase